jgi:predicted transcriptional regulator
MGRETRDWPHPFFHDHVSRSRSSARGFAVDCRPFSTIPQIAQGSSSIRVALTRSSDCPTLCDMKTSTLTIRLDKNLNDLLTKASRRSGRNRSEVAREALRRQLRISQFEALRRKIMPFAEARGYLSDEDVFADVS